MSGVVVNHNGVEMELQDNRKPAILYMWLVAFSAAMGGLMYGYELGVIGQVLGLQCFQYDFGLKVPVPTNTSSLSNTINASAALFINLEPAPDAEFRAGIITSSFLFAGLFGSALGSFAADGLGRKKTIM